MVDQPAQDLLLRFPEGRAYMDGGQMVIELRTPGGALSKTRLPADPEWLWDWMMVFTDACDVLTTRLKEQAQPAKRGKRKR